MSVLQKLFLVITLILILIASAIDQYGQTMPAQKDADAIIVAGCRVYDDGTPSLALKYRTDHAVKLYQEGFADKIIFTGGTPDQRKTEATAARDYALSKYNLPKKDLWLEEASTSTEENASLSSALYPEMKKIILVSDSYHMFRAKRVFDNYFTEVYPSGRVPKYNVRIPGALRELIAIPYYYLQGRL